MRGRIQARALTLHSKHSPPAPLAVIPSPECPICIHPSAFCLWFSLCTDSKHVTLFFCGQLFFSILLSKWSFWSKYQSALPPSLSSSLDPPSSSSLPFKTVFFIGLEFMCHVFHLFNVYSSMVHKLCDCHHNQLKTCSLFQKETQPSISPQHLPAPGNN